MDWLANALLIYCWWDYPRRRAVAAGVLGSIIYAVIAYQMSWWGLLTIELVLAALQVRAMIKGPNNGAVENRFNIH
jgi:hypothetical protein